MEAAKRREVQPRKILFKHPYLHDTIEEQWAFSFSCTSVSVLAQMEISHFEK